MIRSMTGFGVARSIDDIEVSVEIRTVNHRYREICVVGDSIPATVEHRVNSMVKEYIHRGKVDIVIGMRDRRPEGRRVRIDWQLIRELNEAVSMIEARYGVRGNISFADLVQCPGVLEIVEPEPEIEELWDVVQDCLGQALRDVVAAREEEGARLAQDICTRLELIESVLKEIEEMAGALPEIYRARLKTRLEKLCDIELDEDRLMMEVAILAEKCDIHEELTRCYSHLDQFRSIIESGRPVGRKLDFMAQELLRELNTIASKGQDASIRQVIVEAKAEVDKIREQVKNIE